MALILAVEPDPRQASRLSAALCGRYTSQLVIAHSAESAIDAMAGRVPDVLLTSQLLSPQHEQRLADWLKGLGPTALHVQTLTIPIFSPPSKQETQGGLLGALRRRAPKPGPHGCEPSIFADHVGVYLEQGLKGRADTVPDPTIPASVSPPVSVETAETSEDEGAWMLTPAPEFTLLESEAVAEEQSTASIVLLAPLYDLPPDAIDEEPVTTERRPPQVLRVPPHVVTLPLEVVFVPELITVNEDACSTIVISPRAAAAPVPTSATRPAPDTMPRKKITLASTTPSTSVQDEWGLFDPSKCGFSALLNKLEEITDRERSTQGGADVSIRVVTY